MRCNVVNCSVMSVCVLQRNLMQLGTAGYGASCVCVYIRICVFVCVCVYMHVCVYACVYTGRYVCMFVCVSVYLYVCMCVCMHVCMHPCMDVWMMYVCLFLCR